MSTFNLEITSENDICVELYCNECGNKFSTELDINFRNQDLPFQTDDILYCLYCEERYEYIIKFDNNNLQIIFKDDDLFGGLKFSDKVYLDEFKTISPENSKHFYYLQIERLENILDLKSNVHIVDQALYRLIYSGIITCLETYLSEVFTQIVFHSEHTLETFVQGYEPYKREKISLHEIFKVTNSLELKVKDDLDNFIYHNISKLINIFNIFDFELDKFKRIKNIANYIQKRHSFVHRSGVDKNDNLQEVSEKEIKIVIKDVTLFVEHIGEKTNQKLFPPVDDGFDDFPF